MHDRILVPIKPKHARLSSELMQQAVSMARNEHAELIVLSVVPELEANLNARPEDHLPELEAFVAAHDIKDVKVKCMVRPGAPHRAIPRIAGQEKCDLIVMNSHNPRIRDYFIGSTAAHVVMHAKCDVLIVRQKGKAEPQ